MLTDKDFDLKTRQNGKEYYSKGKICSIKKFNCKVYAKVGGYDTYLSTVNKTYGCTCECDEICKHVYALLIKIRSVGQQTIPDGINQLKNYTVDQLIDILKSCADDNADIIPSITKFIKANSANSNEFDTILDDIEENVNELADLDDQDFYCMGDKTEAEEELCKIISDLSEELLELVREDATYDKNLIIKKIMTFKNRINDIDYCDFDPFRDILGYLGEDVELDVEVDAENLDEVSIELNRLEAKGEMDKAIAYAFKNIYNEENLKIVMWLMLHVSDKAMREKIFRQAFNYQPRFDIYEKIAGACSPDEKMFIVNLQMEKYKLAASEDLAKILLMEKQYKKLFEVITNKDYAALWTVPYFENCKNEVDNCLIEAHIKKLILVPLVAGNFNHYEMSITWLKTLAKIIPEDQFKDYATDLHKTYSKKTKFNHLIKKSNLCSVKKNAADKSE
ncbi:MAG: zinc finger SWIM domain protein [Harvfovirus sp.]|uniref:Zinc finger SWIM domain protein n=1 Tax=Harvfovirus sp. TaxID=2487768 RepID=A0A3G5A3U8_9VIRU|nr:MAG: zinc finger SWIM domain protein [Harvfovirus sp.]